MFRPDYLKKSNDDLALIRRELADLRQKIKALEAENALLRQKSTPKGDETVTVIHGQATFSRLAVGDSFIIAIDGLVQTSDIILKQEKNTLFVHAESIVETLTIYYL